MRAISCLAAPPGVKFAFASMAIWRTMSILTNVIVIVSLLELLNELEDVLHYEGAL